MGLARRALVAALLMAAASAGDSDDSYDSYDSSNSSDNGSSASGSQHRWTDAYPCKYYPADDQGCTRPRSCFDCLNTPVDGDNECMINQYGRCIAKTDYTYNPAQDYRMFKPANVEPPHGDELLQFPSDAAQYCDAATDPCCAACRATVFADVMDGTANSSLTRYCYGEHGCVCIAMCEAPWWNTSIGVQVCHGAAPATNYNLTKAGNNGDEDKKPRSIWPLVLESIGAVSAVAMIVVAAVIIRRRRRDQENDNSSSSNSNGEGDAGDGSGGRPPRQTGPQLSLFGWQAMRSELIHREQLLLSGVEDFSGVRTGYIQLLDVQASAPEEDDTIANRSSTAASAPVMLVPLAGASAPPMTPTMPSAPDFDDFSDSGSDDADMAEL